MERKVHAIPFDPVAAEKGRFKHFMQKEIFEQPRAVADTIRGRASVEQGDVELDGVELPEELARRLGMAFGLLVLVNLAIVVAVFLPFLFVNGQRGFVVATFAWGLAFGGFWLMMTPALADVIDGIVARIPAAVAKASFETFRPWSQSQAKARTACDLRRTAHSSKPSGSTRPTMPWSCRIGRKALSACTSVT